MTPNPSTANPSADIVVVETTDRVCTITLNRPKARNALSSQLRLDLAAALNAAESDDLVDVVILTGSDPAFCAGLDLKELGSTGANLSGPSSSESNSSAAPAVTPADKRGPFPPRTKPLIGAINGVAITGGLELALNCDFLIASENAYFADTHARVGVMPGWGLTVLLPQAIGVRRARQMSLTGNFMGAEEALQFGLVNQVVAHDDLLSTCRSLATDIVGNNQDGVRNILGTYAQIHAEADGWATEASRGSQWLSSNFDQGAVADRVAGIQERGRAQQ